MKKSFFSTLLTVTVIAFAAAFVTASAAEPKSAEISPARLDEAKTYYIDNMIIGFNVGVKIAGGPELSPEQTEAVRQKSIQWMNEELLPFLEKNGILEEWVQMQFDKDIRELNRKIAQAKSMDDFAKSAQEGAKLTKLRYQNSFEKFNSPECVKIMQKLQASLMQALIK